MTSYCVQIDFFFEKFLFKTFLIEHVLYTSTCARKPAIHIRAFFFIFSIFFNVLIYFLLIKCVNFFYSRCDGQSNNRACRNEKSDVFCINNHIFSKRKQSNNHKTHNIHTYTYTRKTSHRFFASIFYIYTYLYMIYITKTKKVHNYLNLIDQITCATIYIFFF